MEENKVVINGNEFYNMDCREGCKKHIEDNSIDLIVTDPPFAIEGDELEKHYNRDEDKVLEDYGEIPAEEYPEFSKEWIKQAERILKPGGSIYIFSGFNYLYDILDALKDTDLKLVNHLIWHYPFGVYTKNKYVTSHYHCLYYYKPGGDKTFNTFCRYGQREKNDEGDKLNYKDRQDVWKINKDYKKGETKCKNELPEELLSKIIRYSSNEGDIVCDLFLGSFSTSKVAIGLNRKTIGFEKIDSIFEYGLGNVKNVEEGYLKDKVRKPKKEKLENQGKKWSDEEIARLLKRYVEIYDELGVKKDTIQKLIKEFGRGKFGIDRILKQNNKTLEKMKKKF
ncbi:MAG: DNA methyltransferase [archaeon]